MSELQQQGQEVQAVNIQIDQALSQFERWVNESNQADIAFASGTLGQWIKTKFDRELAELRKGQSHG